MNKNIFTFLGCDKHYSDSDIVVFGAPFDSTTSFRPGTRFASGEMRAQSIGLETYSPYLNKDMEEINVYDGGDLELVFGDTVKTLDIIESYTLKIIKDRKIPVMIGGEHLTTLGCVRAALAEYPDLHIVHFDAHADLREDYLSNKFSHATVMRRCWELTGDGKIFQFGIRSGDREEFLFADRHTIINRFNFNNIQTLANIKQRPVYLTIDLDVLDPSVFPGTGTPEAGGVSFSELLCAMKIVCGLNIVGADLCELSPIYDHSGISVAVACKVLRELLLLL